MAEFITDIHLKVVVNTNKRTIVLDEECDDLDEVVDKVENFRERWEL